MKKLRFIGLANNRIGDRGALPVALNLAQKYKNHQEDNRLEIDLSGNPISEESTALLLRAGCTRRSWTNTSK